mmetsp:Transcript_7831/g.23294  ORF Transcript_7831/g.23294 Transcript_7831/m.23294 type:complete len:241 (+) Transcript_7831:252-974(+)
MLARLARRVPAAARRGVAQRRSLAVIRDRLEDLAADRGETEVLQYPGMKWTILQAKRYGDAIAYALGEQGLGPGDAVASLLPSDAPEAHALQLAAGVSGVVFCAIDAGLGAAGVTDALVASGAKMLVHSGSEAHVALLEEAVPEFATYAARTAKPFYSPAAPALKSFVTTGLDMHPACANYQHLLALDASPAAPAIADDAPLGLAVTAEGTKKWTHREAIEQGAYPALTAVLNAEYKEFA